MRTALDRWYQMLAVPLAARQNAGKLKPTWTRPFLARSGQEVHMTVALPCFVDLSSDSPQLVGAVSFDVAVSAKRFSLDMAGACTLMWGWFGSRCPIFLGIDEALKCRDGTENEKLSLLMDALGKSLDFRLENPHAILVSKGPHQDVADPPFGINGSGQKLEWRER